MEFGLLILGCEQPIKTSTQNSLWSNILVSL
jgi:hypothetical protein